MGGLNTDISIEHRRGAIHSDAPIVCGILNVTPDSFSDGGQYYEPSQAIDHAMFMLDSGAKIIDIGGESTRPGADTISVSEELKRVLPVIEGLRSKSDAVISIDTTKSAVALEAIKVGADIVNDISGGRFDGEMTEAVQKTGAGYICGFVQSNSISNTHLNEKNCPGSAPLLESFCKQLLNLRKRFGSKLIADPCIGFGKSQDTNKELIISSRTIQSKTNVPVMIGVSRKRVLCEPSDATNIDRDHATIGASLAAVQFGASILRVHDVRGFFKALKNYWETILLSKGMVH